MGTATIPSRSRGNRGSTSSSSSPKSGKESHDVDQSSGSGEGSSTNQTHHTNSTLAGTTNEPGDSSDSKISTSSGSSRTGHAQSLLSMASHIADSAKGRKSSQQWSRKIHESDNPIKKEESGEVGAPSRKRGEFTTPSLPKRRRIVVRSTGTSNSGNYSEDTMRTRRQLRSGNDSSEDTSAGQGGDEGGGSFSGSSGSGSEKDIEESGMNRHGRSRRSHGGSSSPFTVPYSGSVTSDEAATGTYPSLSAK